MDKQSEREIRAIFEKYTMPTEGDPELTPSDTDAVIIELADHLEAVKREAEEYWRTYYGMASAEQDPPYDKLTDYQRKVLADYHTRQLAHLSPIKQEEQP